LWWLLKRWTAGINGSSSGISQTVFTFCVEPLKLRQPESVTKNNLTHVSGQSDVISPESTQIVRRVCQHVGHNGREVKVHSLGILQRCTATVKTTSGKYQTYITVVQNGFELTTDNSSHLLNSRRTNRYTMSSKKHTLNGAEMRMCDSRRSAHVTPSVY